MRQVLIGVSVFVALQIAYVIVLLVATLWEARQLDRPMRRRALAVEPAQEARQPATKELNEAA